MNTQQRVQQHVNALDKLADERGFDPVYQEVVRCLHEKLDRRNISPVEFLTGDFSLSPEPVGTFNDVRSEIEGDIREDERDDVLDEVKAKVNAFDKKHKPATKFREAIREEYGS